MKPVINTPRMGVPGGSASNESTSKECTCACDSPAKPAAPAPAPVPAPACAPPERAPAENKDAAFPEFPFDVPYLHPEENKVMMMIGDKGDADDDDDHDGEDDDSDD